MARNNPNYPGPCMGDVDACIRNARKFDDIRPCQDGCPRREASGLLGQLAKKLGVRRLRMMLDNQRAPFSSSNDCAKRQIN